MLPTRWYADDVLTRRELADRLRVDIPATYRWRDCPRVRVGREYRFIWGDVLEWLRTRDQGHSPSRADPSRSTSGGRGEVFRMPHRALTSRDAEGRDWATTPIQHHGSGGLPEGRS